MSSIHLNKSTMPKYVGTRAKVTRDDAGNIDIWLKDYKGETEESFGIQSDWTEADSTADGYIKNKPNLASVATSGSYTDLSDKPTITHDVKTYNVEDEAWVSVVDGNGDAKMPYANEEQFGTVSLCHDVYGNDGLTLDVQWVDCDNTVVTDSLPTLDGDGMIDAGAIPVFEGTDGVDAGASGAVPAPETTDVGSFLCADGSWAVPQDSLCDSEYTTTVSAFDARGVNYFLMGITPTDGTVLTDLSAEDLMKIKAYIKAAGKNGDMYYPLDVVYINPAHTEGVMAIMIKSHYDNPQSTSTSYLSSGNIHIIAPFEGTVSVLK